MRMVTLRFCKLLLRICAVGVVCLVTVWLLRSYKNPLPVTSKPTGCLSTVVTVDMRGRLANAALQYASAWAVSRRFDLELAIPSEMLSLLSYVFPHLSGRSLKQLLKEDPLCDGVTEEHVFSRWRQIQSVEEVHQRVHTALTAGEPVVIRQYLILAEYFVPLLKDLREEFTFQRDLREAAASKLMHARKTVAAKARCHPSQVCSVGVHVRRTDYFEYLKSHFRVIQRPDEAFYTKAVIMMRQDLQAECAAIAFVVTSDHNEWCNDKLMPALKSTLQVGLPPSSAFLLSSPNPLVDLCLMSSCQHSILDFGSFSALSGLLAGGRTIVFNITAHGSPFYNDAMHIARSIGQNWKVIP